MLEQLEREVEQMKRGLAIKIDTNQVITDDELNMYFLTEDRLLQLEEKYKTEAQATEYLERWRI